MSDDQPYEPWHGTYSGYTNHGCRLECCREAMRRYHRDYYQRRTDPASGPLYRMERGLEDPAPPLRPRRSSGQHWTEDEDALVLESDLTAKEIAARLGRSESAVYQRRATLRGRSAVTRPRTA